MFIQDVTPDTSGYMIAGYVIAFVVMGLYVASLYLRTRNLKQDMSMLEEMDVQAAAPVEKKTAAKSRPTSQPKTVTKKVQK
jgi:hypothetical protein